MAHDLPPQNPSNFNINFNIDITTWPINWVKVYKNNARVHSRQQVRQVANSIREFGFTNPILVDANGFIIAGHGRLRAAKELGLNAVPIIQLAKLTPAQVQALRLADNKIALNSGWDADLLRIEFTELIAFGETDMSIDLGVTGFSTGEIDLLLAAPDNPDDEVIPATMESPETELGDIWQLGPHLVGCGDARDPAFIASIVGGHPVDCAFLDPPYNVRINGHANARGRHREFAMASGEMTNGAFRSFLVESLGACVGVSRSGAVHYICMDWRHLDDVSAAANGLYGEQLNLCVWNKSNAGMGSLYRSKHELIYVYRVGEAAHFNAVELGRHGRNRTNVWNYPSVNSFRGSRAADLALHPTVKPVAMVADAIQDVTRRGDLVLDSFLGAGTTLLAAERSGRVFRGLDIDPAYVDLAVRRWAEMTGGQPRLLKGAAHA